MCNRYMQSSKRSANDYANPYAHDMPDDNMSQAIRPFFILGETDHLRCYPNDQPNIMRTPTSSCSQIQFRSEQGNPVPRQFVKALYLSWE